MTNNNKITTGTLVCLDRAGVSGSLSAVKIMSGFIKTYGSSVGIVLEDNNHHVFVLFSNGDLKYIHKTFLKNVGVNS